MENSILHGRNYVLYIAIFLFFRGTVTSKDVTTERVNQTTENLNVIPEGWELFCSMKNSSDVSFRIDYKCFIDRNSSGLWKLETLRNRTDNFQVNYTMDIECIEGSNISLPWPMKVMNLIELKVTNCIVEDYYKDFGNPNLDSTPDQLIVLDLSNVHIIVGVYELLEIANAVDTFSKDYQCGSEDTIVRYISRNITYGFHKEMIFNLLNMSELQNMTFVLKNDKFMEKWRNIPNNCVYKRLSYMDRSISATKSKLYMELVTDTARYPELRVFNLSCTKIPSIPFELQEWCHYFDKLEYMDLSRNNITELQFEDSAYGYNGFCPDFTLDLSYNKISEITASHIQQLSDIPNLFIDLKGNPINCSCNDEVKQLLKLIHNNNIWKKESYRRYEYIKMLQCNEPIALAGRTLISISESDLVCQVHVEYIVDYTITLFLCALALFLIVIIITLIKYRQEIQFSVITRSQSILPCQGNAVYKEKRTERVMS